MELRHLRYFTAVGRCLSFSKAAEMLHVSQPPLSRQIQEFEEEVGAALFDRTGRRTRLTEAGEYLLAESERILESIDVVCRTAKAISLKARVLRIGCVNFFFNAHLARFLEELGKKRPALKTEILVMPSEAQGKALMTGSLELGFVRSWMREDRLDFEPLVEESFSLVYPKSYRLEGEPKECFAALASSPFIGLARSVAPGLADMIAAICAEYGLSPAPAYECTDALSILDLLASGLGWSILPEFGLGDARIKDLRYVHLRQKSVIGICHRKTGLTEEAEAFMAMVKEYFSRPSLNEKGREGSALPGQPIR
jgi:DNA-binding transcriptional LysR family regulator